MRRLFLLLLSLPVLAGPPLDLKELPYSSEMYIVAVDVQANPTNMPNMMLWDAPILLLYKQVSSFDTVRVDEIREELTRDFVEGRYQPVVVRARQHSELRLHFMNLVGLETAPVRVVQGIVCKNCKQDGSSADAAEKAKRAYTFSYGQAANRSQYPYLTSIHAHGVAYTIENDGTNAGRNPAVDPANNGLVAPGEMRTYHYRSLDYPGVWALHDHGNPSFSVGRGLHMALVVEDAEDTAYDHDFLIIFSDYPEYDDYLDEFYGETFVPAFLHMRNGNVMHAHALNGYAAMMMPRMRMAVNMGATKWDAMRTDIVGEPRTPVYDVDLGDLVRFRLLSYGSQTTHSFHIHAHVWWDAATGRYIDNVAVPAGSSYDLSFFAGGNPYRPDQYEDRSFRLRSGPGDWLYHCHIVPHVKHGMWGLFRVSETPRASNCGFK